VLFEHGRDRLLGKQPIAEIDAMEVQADQDRSDPLAVAKRTLDGLFADAEPAGDDSHWECARGWDCRGHLCPRLFG
jgi:hypothetical protein